MRIDESGGVRVLHLDAEGPTISSSADAADLVGLVWGENVGMIAIPVARLDPEFFRLRSLLAGDIVQKLVNYRLNLAVVGDITAFVAASDALRDFVWESNRGTHVWFVPDEAALVEKLAGRA